MPEFVQDSSGDVTVTGDGSTWTNSGELIVGRLGSGTLRIEVGATVSNTNAVIGDELSGSVTVIGDGSTWNNAGVLDVGRFGTGALEIQDGASVTSNAGIIGRNSLSDGNVAVVGAGSTWTMADDSDLRVGYEGSGTLTIEDGGSVSNRFGFIGNQANSSGNVTVRGADSSWTSSRNIAVGFSGTGSLAIESGGRVSNSENVGSSFIGFESDAMGTVSVTGEDSSWTSSGGFTIGESGNGVMNVEDGGRVVNHTGFIAKDSTSTGIVTVAGTGSTWTNSSSLYVGGTDTTPGGQAILNIRSGGSVEIGGELIVWDDGAINMRGGTLKLPQFGPIAGSVDFEFGTIHLTTDQILAADNELAQVIGNVPVFGTGKHLVVDGSATLMRSSSKYSGIHNA